MEASRPSRTALRVALRRAAHQIYDAKPLVLDDPIAIPLLGPTYREELARTPHRTDRPHSRSLRAWLVARSRYAEDSLAASVAAGVTQYVVLGAGLDTFAMRNPHPKLRVFEVDHPATQAWKRDLLRDCNFALPETARLVPVDFEHDRLDVALERAGFDPQKKTFFAWLGVVPYLTIASFRATLRFIEGLPTGSGVVMDYGQPRAVLPPLEQLAHDSLADRVRLAGEPFQLFFTPAEMASELTRFAHVDDLGGEELNKRYFRERSDGLQLLGTAARLLHATL